MTARCLSRGVGTMAAILFACAAVAAEPTWIVEGLDGPESALYDSERNVIYVSNVNGPATEKNGQGYIAKLSPEGNLIEKVWLGGLDAPKYLSGLGLAHGAALGRDELVLSP